MTDKFTPEELAAMEASYPRTPEMLARRFHHMRERIKTTEDHGVTRDQVAELIDGKNGTQLRAVATWSGIDVDHNLTAPEIAKLIIDRAVGDALDARSAVPQSHDLPTGGRLTYLAADQVPVASDGSPSADDPPGPVAVTKWNADAHRMEYGKVIGQTGDRHTVEWDDGYVEQIHATEEGIHFLTAEQKRRETEMRIRDEYRFLAQAEGEGVGIRQIREKMPDISKEDFDAAATNVMLHSDVIPDPLLPLPRSWEKRTSEDIENGVPLGGTTIMTIRMDGHPRRRGGADDAHIWSSRPADQVASYIATLNEDETRRLAENMGVTPSDDPEITAQRIVETSDGNHTKWLADARQNHADLMVLYEAEKATESGYGPETWTPQERAEVAKAAHRRADTTWEPGRRRAAAFAGLSEDGSLGEVLAAKVKDREEELSARQAARDTGQAYIDHVSEGTGACAAGRRHAGPCVSTTPNLGDKCLLCGSNWGAVIPVGQDGAPVCARCTADRAAYDGQPFPAGDSTGIPAHVHQRCPKCRQPMTIIAGTQHFDADGGASVSTVCDNCGIQSGVTWTWSTGTSPATDEDLCDDCQRNVRLGHRAGCPKVERDAVTERFAGTPLPQLELKFDDIVRLHTELTSALETQLDQRGRITAAIYMIEEGVDGMEAGTGDLQAKAAVLVAEMEKARFDVNSIAGCQEAADSLDADDVTNMLGSLDIINDLTYESTGKVQGALNAVVTSSDHVDDTYGAIAAGIQETGVSGAALEGAGTAS